MKLKKDKYTYLSDINNHLCFKCYYNFALNQTAKFLFPIIRRWEISKIKYFGKLPLKHQPVFIIGAPRTGSTILYQTLTNLYDVLYLDNLVCSFHRNLLFGFQLSNIFFGSKPHNNFQANHGSTDGWHSPSECGQFWYKWLPKDHHFIDYDEITQKMVSELRLEISAIINCFDKPLVFKNLNAGQRLRLITECFPEAKFLFITRDPLQTAQSILKSKREIGIADNSFWSIMPPNVSELKGLDWYEQIVKQVYFLEKQIIEDSSLSSTENFFTIQFEELSIDHINSLAQKLGFHERHNPIKPSISVHKKVYVNPIEFKKLKRQVEALDWGFLKNNLNHPHQFSVKRSNLYE